ncbi:MAG: acyltransferase [Bacteroidota bacterium]|nr:acyltransferase [Bacteroidota bacterium]
MKTSFYSDDELINLGFKKIGVNCKISRYARFYSPKSIEIGDNVRIDDFCILSGEVKLGSYVHIAAYSALFGAGGIEMNDFAGLSSRVTIYSITDDYLGDALTGPCIPDGYRKIERGKVHLRKHSLVGASSVIMPNTTLNEGSAIGALSLVKGIVSEWSIYAGVPAKYKKPRKRETMLAYEKELLNFK